MQMRRVIPIYDASPSRYFLLEESCQSQFHQYFLTTNAHIKYKIYDFQFYVLKYLGP
jgi:hypothetical protein